MRRAWYVYIIRCKDGSLYTGITIDLVVRLRRHNDGTGAKYTRSRRPVRLVWSRRMRDEGAARRREARIKRLDKKAKEAMLRR